LTTTLYIAEKPSLAREIALALNNSPERKKNYLDCGNGNIVAWSVGHILRLKTPQEINPANANWAKTAYPIIPLQMEYVKSENAIDLLNTLESLLKKANVVINAGDADREGQLLIDEILEFFGYSGPAKRILITDLTKEGIQKALANMTDNASHKSLSDAGKGRMMADWLLGMNMTMLYTVTAQKNGYRGTPISIGRVQTPVLGLVVNRDKIIENFISKKFYTLHMVFRASSGDDFSTTWRPKEIQTGLDEDGRLIDEAVKNSLIGELNKAVTRGERGSVEKLAKKKKKEHPPLPHSLPTLQIEASDKFGISPSDTLKLVQELYEAKILSYPRSDCQYLPESMHGEAKQIFDGITANAPALNSAAGGGDISKKSAAFNDGKVAEHYAIIPTGKTGNMNDSQAKIFGLSALRFIAQFYPDHEYLETEAEVQFSGEIFGVKGRETTQPGWQVLFTEQDTKDMETTEKEDSTAKIPSIKDGEALAAVSVGEKEKNSTPPKRFTDGTLLKAMNNVHLYVTDKEIKKTLKENDGIGTAATQAEIINKLFERLYIVKNGKNILSTDKGRHLISILPEALVTPDKTALWEREMKSITDNKCTLGAFIKDVGKEVNALVADAKERAGEIVFEAEAPTPSMAGDSASPCPKCASPMKLLNGKNGKFWLCTNQTCKMTCDDSNGKPKKPHLCPRCKAKLIRRDGKKGPFWPCNSCGLILDDAGGKPQKTKKCPKCEKGYLKYAVSKDGKTHFWKCSDCDSREFENKQ
jgi:DNA topoisomerase-3